jgi:hypothetical protein
MSTPELEPLEVVEGIEGNVYEMLPDEALYTAETKKADRQAAAEKGPDLDAAAKAKDVIEAGAAAPDHGKPAGAGNALTFHNWDDNADSKKSDQGDD